MTHNNNCFIYWVCAIKVEDKIAPIFLSLQIWLLGKKNQQETDNPKIRFRGREFILLGPWSEQVINKQ